MRKSNYDKYPATRVDGIAIQGWNEIICTLEKAWGNRPIWGIDRIPVCNSSTYQMK